MKKTPTIFMRDFDGNPKFVTPDPNPECKWVFDGEGVPTRKYDGTCCMFDGKKWWKRREVKRGKLEPDGFSLSQHDETTGKKVGWVPVEVSDKWHTEAIEAIGSERVVAGTYELCGPKVQGNPEGFESHVMVSHSDAQAIDCPRTYDGLKTFMNDFPHEGVVFHHEDGRMAKIKRRDFY